jgi:hypothetical protein
VAEGFFCENHFSRKGHEGGDSFVGLALDDGNQFLLIGFHFVDFFGADVSVFAFFGLAVLEGLEDDFLEISDISEMRGLKRLIVGEGFLRQCENEVGLVFHMID